jgi:hypothetical protein
MEKLRLISDRLATPSDAPEQSSKPISPQIRLAKAMADKLFDLLPPLDVGDPEAFIAGTIAILAQYPGDVMLAAIDPANGIPSRTDRPTLRLIKQVCEEYWEPIERGEERALYARRARESAAAAPPLKPRSAEEQAAVDARVAAVRAELGIPAHGLPRRAAQTPLLERAALSKDLLADLERRKARNKAREALGTRVGDEDSEADT